MAGYTKEQIWAWARQEDRKRREYNEQMAQRSRERAEQLLTIGMLLEAGWSSEYKCFVKITKSTHPNGIASHWETFYNEAGEEVPRPKGYKSA